MNPTKKLRITYQWITKILGPQLRLDEKKKKILG